MSLYDDLVKRAQELAEFLKKDREPAEMLRHDDGTFTGWPVCTLIAHNDREWSASEVAYVGADGQLYMFYVLSPSRYDTEDRKPKRRLKLVGPNDPWPNAHKLKTLKAMKEFMER